jgi:translocator protein
MMMGGAKKWLGLVGWLAVSYSASLVETVATEPSFYQTLDRPAWAPPASLFGPVWTLLYALIGVAAWLVWIERGIGGARGAFLLFFAQHLLNALWSWLFFGWERIGLALVEIGVLWVLILLTTFAFHRHRPVAGLLLIPYLIWVAYAAALNFALWRLNP